MSAAAPALTSSETTSVWHERGEDEVKRGEARGGLEDGRVQGGAGGREEDRERRREERKEERKKGEGGQRQRGFVSLVVE